MKPESAAWYRRSAIPVRAQMPTTTIELFPQVGLVQPVVTFEAECAEGSRSRAPFESKIRRQPAEEITSEVAIGSTTNVPTSRRDQWLIEEAQCELDNDARRDPDDRQERRLDREDDGRAQRAVVQQMMNHCRNLAHRWRVRRREMSRLERHDDLPDHRPDDEREQCDERPARAAAIRSARSRERVAREALGAGHHRCSEIAVPATIERRGRALPIAEARGRRRSRRARTGARSGSPWPRSATRSRVRPRRARARRLSVSGERSKLVIATQVAPASRAAVQHATVSRVGSGVADREAHVAGP